MARFLRGQPGKPRYGRPDLGPVYFDQASNSGYQVGLATYTWSHTVTVGTVNRALIVGVGIFLSGSVTGITFDGVALTKIRHDASGIYRSELWRLVAPNTGTRTVEVTLNTSLTSIGNAQSYYGVDQTTPIDANDGAVGTNSPASASVTTITNFTRVVGNIATQTASGVVPGAGQAPRTTNAGAAGTDSSDEKGIITPAGSVSFSWTGMGTLDVWTVSLAALRPVSAIAQLYQTLLTLLGMGS